MSVLQSWLVFIIIFLILIILGAIFLRTRDNILDENFILDEQRVAILKSNLNFLQNESDFMSTLNQTLDALITP